MELNKVVDIYDAQSAYFDTPEKNRQRFKFRCSDKEFRRVKYPLVSDVNYQRLAEETEKYRQPHFCPRLAWRGHRPLKLHGR